MRRGKYQSNDDLLHVMKNKGFTLIELLTAVTIFTVVMTISMGAIIGIFDANRKSRSLKTMMSNLNLAVESMAKEMRFGQNYHCGSGNVTIPQNCATGGTLMSFLSSENVQITYQLNGAAIEKQIAGGTFSAVTAPDTIIDSMTFYTLGSGTADTLQPKVIIIIKSHSGTGKSRTDFTLETLVSQRVLDI